jgi:YVTN family beta-propeller protein
MKRLLSFLFGLTVLAVVASGTVAAARLEGDGYVGCSASDNCVPFDLETHTPSSSIDLLPEGNYPYDATMRPGGAEVWIVGNSGDAVVVIDVATNVITHRIPVGDYPNSLCFTDDGTKALVSSRNDDEVSIINTATYAVTGTLPVGTGSGGTYDGPGNMALDPVSKNIYAVDWYDDHLYEIAPDASAVLDAVVIGSSCWQLVVDPDGEYIYVTDRGTDQVRVIDQDTLAEVTAVAVGDDPWGIDVTEDGAYLVVACEDNSSAYVIDTADWAVTPIFLETGADPRDVDIRDDQGYAYVAGGSSPSGTRVYVVEPSTHSLKSSFLVEYGSNANVIAVQEQMTSGGTGVPEIETARLGLSCFPNPFNPKTTVSYHLPEAAEVELAVYDVAGRRVVVLASGVREAGDHAATWDGKVDGHPAATGVYFVRLTAGGSMRTIKAALLK